MNILLTNDDGYNAPGLAASYRALAGLGSLFVVAPRTERSACSHSITLRRPIGIERCSHDPFGELFIVDGTPADCVRLAVAELLGETIDLVVSGINRGANSGIDLYYSGTVAAAREGAILGIRSISVSQALRTDVETDWAAASKIAGVIVAQLLAEDLPGPGFWSVNLPAPIPPNPVNHIRRVPVSTEPMPLNFKAVPRVEPEDGDGDAARVTPENVDAARVMKLLYGVPYWDRPASGPSDFSTICDGDIAVSAVPLYGRF